ncbi:ABC transporter ATP-binding protein [Tistrella mobilis]|uniref:ABC transporter ATP-binding protein n=1 Tax=Tistrella mobilis TaxID=171437 RepID=UPI00355865E2
MNKAIPVLETRNLQKSFGAVTAARDISVAVEAGTRLSVIGSNGAGKTTFVNMVTGYLKPDEGSILLAGEDVTRLDPRRLTRRGIARSFQIPQLCAELTALENMLVARAAAEGGLPFFRPARSAAARDAALEVLERFGLASIADRPVLELAGGTRKLLDIALAMTGRPKLLMLDEPTSGVSAEEKFPFMDRIMAALDQDGVTVLFVEHDMDIVGAYADRVLAFYAGQIIADGAPDLVMADEGVRRHVTGH